MIRRLLLIGLLSLSACASQDGLLVSPDAEPVGGGLFVEVDEEGRRYLVLDGEITSDTSYYFQALTESFQIPSLVIAQSPGGDLFASHQIGRSIRAQNMHTVVLAECLSACVDVFIAGKRREIADTAELGLHAAFNPDPGVEVDREIDRRYWREMGFPAVNEQAYAVPEGSLWVLSAERALELGLATMILRPDA